MDFVCCMQPGLGAHASEGNLCAMRRSKSSGTHMAHGTWGVPRQPGTRSSCKLPPARGHSPARIRALPGLWSCLLWRLPGLVDNPYRPGNWSRPQPPSALSLQPLGLLYELCTDAACTRPSPGLRVWWMGMPGVRHAIVWATPRCHRCLFITLARGTFVFFL